MAKSEVPLKDKLKLPCPVTCGQLLPIFPGWFTPIRSLLLCPSPLLITSVRITRLPKWMFRSPCPRMSMVAVFWLHWIKVGGPVVSSKHNPEPPEGCEPPTTNNLGSKDSVLIGNKVVSTPARLVWAYWSVTNFLEEYFQAECTVVVDFWVNMRFLYWSHALQFVRFGFPPHFHYCHSLFS